MNEFIEIPASKKSLGQRKSIFGVGINDANYITRIERNGKSVSCPYYMVWKSMITRCHSERYQKKQPSYIDCSVSDEWKFFSTFRRWMKKQSWEGNDLDKDILEAGNKHYSSETCIFIPRSLNALLLKRESARGEWPIGVHLHKKGVFRANCCDSGKIKHLGLFDTPEGAERAYREFKSNHVREIAKEYIGEVRLYDGLIRHADLILNGG